MNDYIFLSLGIIGFAAGFMMVLSAVLLGTGWLFGLSGGLLAAYSAARLKGKFEGRGW